MKTCTNCKKEQSLTEFYERAIAGLYDSQCRTCLSNKAKARRKPAIKKAKVPKIDVDLFNQFNGRR